MNVSVEQKRSFQPKGGILCQLKRLFFLYSPLERLSFDPNNKANAELQIEKQEILASCSSSNEQYVILSGTHNRVIDVDSGKLIRDIYEHDGFISAISADPTNPNCFASVGTDGIIRIWDVRQHPAVTLQRRLKRYSCLQYSPDSNFLAFAGDSINLMNLNNPRDLISFASSSFVNNISFNPYEYILAASDTDNVIKFWDIDSKECVSQTVPLDSEVQKFAFSSDGSHLIAATKYQLNSFCFEPYEHVHQQNLLGNSMQTLDLVVNDREVFHLGFNKESMTVKLATVTLDIITKSRESSSLDSDFKDSGIHSNGHHRFTSPPHSLDHFSELTVDPEHSPSSDGHSLTSSGLENCFGPRSLTENTFTETVSFEKMTGQKHQIRDNIVLTITMDSSPKNGRNGVSRSSSMSNRAIDLSVKKTRKSSVDVHPQTFTALNAIEQHNAKVTAKQSQSKNTESDYKAAIHHSNIMELLSNRLSDCRKVQKSLRNGEPSDEVLSKASQMPGLHMFVTLVNAYRVQSSCNLRFYSRVLPHARQLLSHSNPEYVNLALDLLNQVLNEYSDQLREVSPSNGKPTSDEKTSHAAECLKALTEIYVNSPFLISRLNEEQKAAFNSLQLILQSLVE